MKKIDFMTNQEYIIPSDHNQDLKMAIILPDGTMLMTDKSHDDEPFSNYGITDSERRFITVHVDYARVLAKHFFLDNAIIQEAAKNENLYTLLMEIVHSGCILFNNNTTYTGPMFILHQKHGQLLIPDDVVTEEQLESLQELDSFLHSFRSIEVKKFHSLDGTNEAETIYGSGEDAISTYLGEKHGNKKIT